MLRYIDGGWHRDINPYRFGVERHRESCLRIIRKSLHLIETVKVENIRSRRLCQNAELVASHCQRLHQAISLAASDDRDVLVSLSIRARSVRGSP